MSINICSQPQKSFSFNILIQTFQNFYSLKSNYPLVKIPLTLVFLHSKYFFLLCKNVHAFQILKVANLISCALTYIL